MSDARPGGVDTGPCEAVAGLGHQGVRAGGSGRGALPGSGRQGAVQDDQGGHDAPHVSLQRRHPALAPQLPPAE